MAGDLKAQLEISADASGVEAGIGKAKRSLADLGATAAKAGKQASEGIDAIGQGGQGSAQKVDAATRNIIGSIQRTTAVVEAGSRSSRQYFEALAAQRGVDTSSLKPYLDQLDAANAKQAIASQSLDKVGISAKQTTAALRSVPAQFTDIVTSLQGGQAPLTVFLQQGGQLKDLFGGIAPAAQALGGYVLGLINPFTLLAAAAAGLAFAYKTGSEEADAFNRALILTGNSSGQTLSQLTEMARRIDGVVGTQAQASAALAEFISAGAIGADNLERFAATALRLEKTTGQAVSETAKQFAELGRAPLEASIRLNQATNFLTVSLYNQIKALEQQGKTTEAATLAQNAYSDAMDSRTDQIVQNLGYIEAGWKAVTKATKEALDATLAVGRGETNGDKIAQLSEQIAQSRERLARFAELNPGRDLSGTMEQAKLNALLQTQAALQENERIAKRAALQEAESAKKAKARFEFEKETAKYLDDQSKKKKEIADIEAKGKAAGATPKEISDLVKAVEEKYRDKTGSRAGDQLAKSQLGFDLDAIKAAQSELVNVYANSEKLLEARRATGLIQDAEYYEAKRSFIRLNAEAEEDALQKQLDRLQRETLSSKERIDNERKIAETQSKIAKVRQDAVTEQEVISERQKGALDKEKAAFEEARQSAEAYLASINKQYDRNLTGIGRGQQFRDRQSGLNQIDDRYEQQRLSLEADRRRNQISKEAYEAELAIINEFNAKARQSYDDYYAKIEQAQADWLNGANESFSNYIDSATNVAAQSESLFTNAFRGMEDAIVGFTLTGKLSFKQMAESIIADIIRIQARQAIAGLAGSRLGAAGAGSGAAGAAAGNAFTGATMSAAGGFDIPAGINPVTQLHAREMVLPEKYADVIRDLAAGQSGAGGMQVSVQVDASGSSVAGNGPQSQELGRMIGNAVREVIVREKMPGGMLA